MSGETGGVDRPSYNTTGPRDAAAFERARASHGTAHETPDLHRLLVETVRDYAIFALDRTGHILTWNAGAERFKGWRAGEIIGRHFSVFYPPEDRAAGRPARALREAMLHGHFEDEGWRVRKDGCRFWASVVITALLDETGAHLGFAKVTRDLTERRKAQERAIADARRVAEMEAANRAKSEFLTMLSHELRTPLNAIGGYTDLLTLEVSGTVNEAQREYLERIHASQRHLLSLVNDLLNLSRLEAGGLDYEIGPVPVRELLEEASAMIQPQAMARRITLETVDCPPDVLARADAARAQQILLNLLSNAVKFTPAGGRISLACSFTADQVGISVLDTGPGIAEDELESIFHPFVQLGRSLISTREGIGLGLAISRDLARAMGGDLVVASRPGEGSTFTLLLPQM